jgi:hypothetical protein
MQRLDFRPSARKKKAATLSQAALAARTAKK